MHNLSQDLRKYIYHLPLVLCCLILLVKISTNNPREFWAQMKRLGPRKVTSIPMKVHDVNGNITADIGKVLNGCKLGFEI